MPKLRNGSKGHSNQGSFGCEYDILPLCVCTLMMSNFRNYERPYIVFFQICLSKLIFYFEYYRLVFKILS